MQGVLLAERFRISERLGSGGMGEVWAAEDERMGRTVAVKLVQALRVEEAETQARFQREVRLAGRLSHQNIVTVHDWGEEVVGGRRTLYVVMERVPGASLRRRLDEADAPPPWPTAVGWARQICQALHVAHGRNVIHRDIKPANVLLTPDGTIKVLDFGVAKFVGDTLSTHELTITGALIGSPPYMSPEQAEGDQDVDHRSDLYSLGCLLHHAVTGEPPFTARNPLAILRMQVDKAPVPPSDRSPDLPRSLSDLIMALLEKRPENRPAHAADVHAALSTLLVDHVVTLPDENPLDIVGLGHTDPLAGRILERAWQIWRSTETHSAALREETDRRRAEADQVLRSARVDAERLLTAASAQAQEATDHADRMVAEARRLRDAAKTDPAEYRARTVELQQEALRLREEAERLRSDAVAEADKIRAEARKEAEAQIEEAAKSAEALLTEAQAEADALRSTARADGDRVRAEAVERATSLRRQAEEALERLHVEVERRRAEAADDLPQQQTGG
ncbi:MULTISPECIES: serine/threonine-protein kinase [unclassified Streptomyces]|uniref:serine/threonine-protein kinase n=1 Tax=unclassified Streptomyces TaxID=2593676 RepID=UPI000F702654|nr:MULTISPECIES: serine/threonine-protein kinase [unclassified Streptomyces]AZM61703.1 serine/threonine protein kinase [Streptomyces sp. WAC 01438]RSN02155.1 serine/threonine protein kinase [Streptomyces sp. WAC 01420]